LRIAITGTPGTGKSTVGKILSERLGIPVYNLSKLIKEKGFFTEFDEKRDAYVVDAEKLQEFFRDKESYIAEGLVAHYVPADLIVILRAKPEVVVERLRPRGYSEEKLKENAEAERLAVIATEVFESSPNSRVAHIDTTNRTPEEVAELIEKALKGEEVFDEVDWLEDETGSY